MISIVIPVFNEELIIDQLYTRTTSALEKIGLPFEIICINDGSSDSSLEKLVAYNRKDNRFKVVDLSRNFGHQKAILSGLNYASGDFIGIMDGDLQDPPEVFEEFFNKLKSESYDVVYAVRKKRKESAFKKFSYWLYYRMLKFMSAENIPLDSGDFCLMTKRVKDHIIKYPEQSLFIRGIRHWVGYKQVGMEYERDSRQAGETKYSFAKLLQLAANGVFSFSNFPIKFLGSLGFFTISLTLIYTVYLLSKRMFWGEVPQGFTTLILAIIFFGGVQLVSIRILGEYITRIYDESRDRPLFVVKDFYSESK
ncbi:glycosyltransferase family 2 protein [Portibacter lacus]|uniref:Glycosyltransferase YkcC n=1 Tax=Portibacter lacus TaxID=1099794 RepID=A0AA37SLI9_9BACT|nr:glycosyltransferase family 2 protein [Portibacter lacus]GLR16337.1 putative glycosyltransferase YkcC [Portibacter lacus]